MATRRTPTPEEIRQRRKALVLGGMLQGLITPDEVIGTLERAGPHEEEIRPSLTSMQGLRATIAGGLGLPTAVPRKPAYDADTALSVLSRLVLRRHHTSKAAETASASAAFAASLTNSLLSVTAGTADLATVGAFSDPIESAQDFASSVVLGMPDSTREDREHLLATLSREHPVAVMSAELAALFVALLTARKVSRGATMADILGRRAGFVGNLTPSSVAAVTGGLLGVGATATLADDPSTLDYFKNAIGGAAGGHAIAAYLFGRPMGQVGLQLYAAERNALFANRAAALGRAFVQMPNLTVGQMVAAGAMGAGWGVTQAMGRGVPHEQALTEGLRQGLEWMSFDYLLAPVGTAARALGTMSQVERALTLRLQDLAIPFAKGRTLGARGAADIARVAGPAVRAGTVFGAAEAAEEITGLEFPFTAKAILAGTASAYLARVRSVLPKRIWKPMLEGRLTDLSADDLAAVASRLLVDSTEEVARHLTPVERDLLRRAVGRGRPIVPGEPGARAMMGQAQAEAARLLAQGVPADDPRILALGGRVFAARQALVDEMKRAGVTLSPRAEAVMRELAGSADTPSAKRINETLTRIYAEGGSISDEARRVIDELSGMAEVPRGLVRWEPAPSILAGRLGERAARPKPLPVAEPLAALHRDALSSLGIADADSARAMIGRVLNLRPSELAPGRRVSPRGVDALRSPLPFSIPRQAVSSTPKTRASAIKALKALGLELRVTGQGRTRRFQAVQTAPKAAPVPERKFFASGRTPAGTQRPTVTSTRPLPPLSESARQGAAQRAGVVAAPKPPPASVVAEGKDLPELWGALRKLGSARGATIPEAAIKATATVGASVLGSVAAARLARLITDDDEVAIGWPVFGAVFAGLAANAAGLRGTGLFSLRPSASRFLQVVKPTIINKLEPAAAAKLVGKSIGTRQFLRLPLAQQYEHLRARVRIHAERRNLSKAERIKAIQSSMRRYTPEHLPPDDSRALITDLAATLRDLGASDLEIAQSIRGFLVNAMKPVDGRLRSARVNVLTMGRRAKGHLGHARTWEDLADIWETARVVSGPEVDPLSISAQTAKTHWKQQLTPKAQHIQKALADLQREDAHRVADPDDTIVPLFGKIRPPLQYLSIARRLQANAAHASSGRLILRGYHAVTRATKAIRQESDALLAEVTDLLGPFKLADRRLIREAMEQPETAKRLAGTNPEILAAAHKLRATFNKLAKEVGLPEDHLIEWYFPWYYSTRTIRQLVKDGVLTRKGASPNDFLVPADFSRFGITHQKLFRSLYERGASPLGQVIDDPLEAARIYIAGAVRKKHLDALIAQLDDKFWSVLNDGQPIIAADMRRWFLDVLGIPSPSLMAWTARFERMAGLLDRLEFMGFNRLSMIETMADALREPGAVQRVTGWARGGTAVLKLGGNWISAAINLTQLPINVGTELGPSALFYAGTKLVSPTAGGKELRAAVREHGLRSDTSRALFEDMLLTAEPRPVKGALAAAGAGVAGAALTSTVSDEPLPRAAGGAAAAGATAALAVAYPRFFARALRRMVDNVALGPFQAVEFINRHVTVASAIEKQKGIAKGGFLGSRAADVLDDAITFAGGGAAVVGLGSEEGERLKGAVLGGLAGGAARLALHRVSGSRGVVSHQRELLRELRRHLDDMKVEDIQKRFLDSMPFKTDEISRFYGQTLNDITQFRFGREARGTLLRTPHGEVMGSLQSFTLNQMEFAGERAYAFFASGGRDVRFLRYLSLVGGVSAVYTALFNGLLGAEKDQSYWLYRIGFGLIPFISYNENTNQWGVVAPAQQLLGPFVDTVKDAAMIIVRLMADPLAIESFADSADELARDLAPMFMQLEDAPEAIGHALGAPVEDVLSGPASALAFPFASATGASPGRAGGASISSGRDLRDRLRGLGRPTRPSRGR